MRVVVFGARGFLGSAVSNELEGAGHDVFTGTNALDDSGVDLLDADSVRAYIREILPKVIINCAGIVSTDGDFGDNVRFTRNILDAAQALKDKAPHVLVTGSAGEYGEVKKLPVSESEPLNAVSPYAVSKVEEERAAQEFSERTGVPVTVLRVFNPIGSGMKDRYLIPSLLSQLHACREGLRKHIEVSRLDAMRDYIDVRDVSVAFRLIAEKGPKQHVYNVGSGVSTSNRQLIDTIMRNYPGLVQQLDIVETSDISEPQIASQADTTRMRHDFGWHNTISLEQTVREIISAAE